MNPGDSSVPPPPPRVPGATATSLSALAQTQHPSEPAPSIPPSPGGRGPKDILRYVALGATTALGVVAVMLVYRAESAPKPIVLHGSPGVRRTEAGATVRWRARQTTVYIDSSVDRLGPRARDAIRNAFGTWLEGDARLPALTFDTMDGAKARLKADGKSSVLFAPITIENHERDLAITITYSDDKTGNVQEADVVINAAYGFAFLEPATAKADGHDANDPAQAASNVQEPKSATGENGQAVTVDPNLRAERHSSCSGEGSKLRCEHDAYDLENVLAHEVGHFFGLGEDMSDTSATMYLCTNRCETHKRQPTTTDRAALAALYPTAADFEELPEPGCGGAALASSKAPAHGGFLALISALMSWTRRRPRFTSRSR